MENRITKCRICGSTDLKELANFPDFPIDMSCNDTGFSHTSDMTFVVCGDCHVEQIAQNIDRSLLYQQNHNIAVVGKTWKLHYERFARFINFCQYQHIYEIGDPSEKLAGPNHHLVQTWDIIEPNPHKQDHDNIRYHRAFFDKNTIIPSNIDCVVASHVLEHAENPVEFLNTISKQKSGNCDIYISVPDMSGFYNFDNPALCLSFEHPYFINLPILQNIASRAKLTVCTHTIFANHSLFAHIIRNRNWGMTKLFHQEPYHGPINKMLARFKSKAQSFSSNRECYIYGAHVTTQFLLANNPDIKALAILDAAPHKIGKILCGTNLQVYSPETLNRLLPVDIITSHCGTYQAEIEENLKKINPNVRFL